MLWNQIRIIYFIISKFIIYCLVWLLVMVKKQHHISENDVFL